MLRKHLQVSPGRLIWAAVYAKAMGVLEGVVAKGVCLADPDKVRHSKVADESRSSNFINNFLDRVRVEVVTGGGSDGLV